MISSTRIIRAAAGVIILAIVLIIVLNFWSDFRGAGDGTSTSSKESTQSPDASNTVSPGKTQGSGAGTPSTAPSIGTLTVLVDGLNFRTGATRDADLIRGLDAGEKLTLLAEEGEWYRVSDTAGKVGYVSSSSQYTKVAK
ncbi:MAG: SH3 domain-containing protein [Coriobacteriia bacterium]|nr:SH3 domain-containing protein [Coriobacteriia bacterium]